MIQLDETGIKLVNNKKDSIYLMDEEIDNFIDGNYTLTESSLIINNKELPMNEKDFSELNNVREYTKGQLRETD